MLLIFIAFYSLYSIGINGDELVTAAINGDQELRESVRELTDKLKKALEEASEEELEEFLKQLQIIVDELEKVNAVAPERVKGEMTAAEKTEFAVPEKSEARGKCVDYKYAFFCCPTNGKGKCIPCEKGQSSNRKCCKDAEDEGGWGDRRGGAQQSPFVIPPWYPPLLTIYPTTPCPVPATTSCCATRRGPPPITLQHVSERSPPPAPV